MDNIVKLPQLIDPHVHFRTPGMTHKEDWDTGSRAAILGGITTVLDMPNTKPPTTTLELLEEKKKMISRDALVNHGFHFGAATDNLAEIPKVLKKVSSVKIFLNHSTGNLQITDDKVLEKIFHASPLITVHAEDEMIEKAIWLTERAGNQLYFCHTYGQEMLEYIKKYKKKLPIFVEVTPHHLFLTQNKSNDPFYRMLPPLQSSDDNEALWQAIDEGIVDTIGTDHAPHTKEEKNSDNPPFGVPNVETVLPLMLNSVNEGRLSLDRLIELMSINPAKIFNIQRRDDTFTEVDMDAIDDIKEENLLSKCGWSPFTGWRIKGWPTRVVINGNEVMRDNIVNTNYKGKYLYE